VVFSPITERQLLSLSLKHVLELERTTKRGDTEKHTGFTIDRGGGVCSRVLRGRDTNSCQGKKDKVKEEKKASALVVDGGWFTCKLEENVYAYEKKKTDEQQKVTLRTYIQKSCALLHGVNRESWSDRVEWTFSMKSPYVLRGSSTAVDKNKR
jgi:hypothetical protein